MFGIKRSTPGAIVSTSEQKLLLVVVDATPIASLLLATPPFGTFTRIIHFYRKKIAQMSKKMTKGV